MDPNFTPGSDEHEQQLFQEQQDFLYSVLISSLKTEFSEAWSRTMREMPNSSRLLHEHHTGNSQYSRAEINRITKYLTNIKLDDTWRGTNESFLDRILSTTPGAEPPRDAKDSGSARSHSTHLETSSSDRP